MVPCGTRAAYRRHLRNGEAPCLTCREFENERCRIRYARQKASGELPPLKAPRPKRFFGCHTCLELFESHAARAKYCSDRCRPRNSVRRVRQDLPKRTGRPWLRVREQVILEEVDCGICGGVVDKSLRYPDPRSASVDHVVPLSRGGDLLDRLNLRLAHWSCNTKRGSRRAHAISASP